MLCKKSREIRTYVLIENKTKKQIVGTNENKYTQVQKLINDLYVIHLLVSA